MKRIGFKTSATKKSVAIFLIAIFTCLVVIFINFSNNDYALSYRASDKPSPYILVDQFGYRPDDSKIAVITQPEDGNSNIGSFSNSRYLSDTYQVISLDTGNIVYEASAVPWQDGNAHSQSGDHAAWFDFTQVQNPGKYIVKNAQLDDASSAFQIADNVYQDILVSATRMYFYQRSGFAKQIPFADSRWTDNAAFLGNGQDPEARFVNDKNNAALERDMRGGWFDAGDTNKYVTFAVQSIHQLLDAYIQNSTIWTDDFNIPESGNGIPDLLDEVRFELDWLQRMQDEDGGAFIKIGTLNYDWATKPSLDHRPRFYGPKCSSSTISIAGMFAHAAWIFKDISGLENYSQTLQDRALIAWDWFNSHPIQTDCDTQEIKAGDADISIDGQIGFAINAAVYLFALTGDHTYSNYVVENFQKTRPFREFGWAIYEPYVGDALLTYAQFDDSDLETKNRIINTFINSVKPLLENQANLETLDPYRAYIPDDQYHWGSNAVKSNLGNVLYDTIIYDVALDSGDSWVISPLDMLHYLHGVNPLGMVYLTNMYDYGVNHSANEMYHEWFGQGIYDNALTSPSGPAPGYLTGGPNKNYTGFAPLAELPPMKAYLDSNKGGDLRMWEITEPSITYQSAYIKLLSKFVTEAVY